MLLPNEVSVIREALAFKLAGENDYSVVQEAAANSAAEKLGAAPAKSVWLPFSQAELALLWEAIMGGAEGVLKPSSGLTAAKKRSFENAANRIADAGGNGPRF